jgi:hypothetical protein
MAARKPSFQSCFRGVSPSASSSWVLLVPGGAGKTGRAQRKGGKGGREQKKKGTYTNDVLQHVTQDLNVQDHVLDGETAFRGLYRDGVTNDEDDPERDAEEELFRHPFVSCARRRRKEGRKKEGRGKGTVRRT